ncbi:conjugal transfer protein TraP [Candidatus Pantoea floridensis]|uniref:Intracellular multiplication protein IcmG n=1 Tax=Candidatus Pantoea floridensis TaxID=1938870 RepID=A0A286DSF2_9GAMM|nr:conjugal transfer protein TraP [Pantoea floridensis]PIF06911.1 intracellular multiplication protein IcmG [Enterobacteriaceae bacterium JKS000233]SOD61579.1 intracellular multiplication protein IcmG [Pantoea floridensis]
MNEFDPQPAVSAPDNAPVPAPPVQKKESLLTRKLWLGQSLPWLAGGAIVLLAASWFLLVPSSSAPDAGQLAFGQDPGFGSVQPAPAPAASPVTPAPAPAPPQTGGLSVPAGALNDPAAGGSVPDDVVKLIHEGREFEAANREAITRLSDTVRAQSRALTTLQQRLEGVEKENARLGNLVTVLAVRPDAAPGHAAAGQKRTRSALSGMRLESLQNGMAWISWQGRTWAVQAGDSLGGVTVREVNTDDRSITTSAGVLR